MFSSKLACTPAIRQDPPGLANAIKPVSPRRPSWPTLPGGSVAQFHGNRQPSILRRQQNPVVRICRYAPALPRQASIRRCAGVHSRGLGILSNRSRDTPRWIRSSPKSSESTSRSKQKTKSSKKSLGVHRRTTHAVLKAKSLTLRTANSFMTSQKEKKMKLPLLACVLLVTSSYAGTASAECGRSARRYQSYHQSFHSYPVTSHHSVRYVSPTPVYTQPPVVTWQQPIYQQPQTLIWQQPQQPTYRQPPVQSWRQPILPPQPGPRSTTSSRPGTSGSLFSAPKSSGSSVTMQRVMPDGTIRTFVR